MCLESGGPDVDTTRMSSDEPVFKKACHVCGRPALTLDEAGNPLCPTHADGFIGSESTYGTLRHDDLDEES